MGKAEEKELASEAFRLLRKIRRDIRDCENPYDFFEAYCLVDSIGEFLKKARRK